MATQGSDLQAWLSCLASSLACVFGALSINGDLLIRQLPGHHDFDLRNDKRFLVGGLSLGAGVLLFTALYRILPEGLDYLQVQDSHGRQLFEKTSYAQAVLIASFLTGIVLCIALNSLLHRLTPKSVIHCGDEDEDDSQESALTIEQNPSQQDGITSRDESLSYDRETNGLGASTPLLGKPRSGSLRPPIGYVSSSTSHGSTCRRSDRSFCAGYTSPCRHETAVSVNGQDTKTVDHRMPGSAQQSTEQHLQHLHHHHHVTEERRVTLLKCIYPYY